MVRTVCVIVVVHWLFYYVLPVHKNKKVVVGVPTPVALPCWQQSFNRTVWDRFCWLFYLLWILLLWTRMMHLWWYGIQYMVPYSIIGECYLLFIADTTSRATTTMMITMMITKYNNHHHYHGGHYDSNTITRTRIIRWWRKKNKNKKRKEKKTTSWGCSKCEYYLLLILKMQWVFHHHRRHRKVHQHYYKNWNQSHSKMTTLTIIGIQISMWIWLWLWLWLWIWIGMLVQKWKPIGHKQTDLLTYGRHSVALRFKCRVAC